MMYRNNYRNSGYSTIWGWILVIFGVMAFLRGFACSGIFMFLNIVLGFLFCLLGYSLIKGVNPVLWLKSKASFTPKFRSNPKKVNHEDRLNSISGED